MKHSQAFSLVEVALALGIVAFAMLGVFGLLPVALQSARDSVDYTRTTLVEQDVAARLPSLVSPNASDLATATVNVTWYYDATGRRLTIDPTASAPYVNAFYRVDVKRASPNTYPSNTDPGGRDPGNTYSTVLMGATVTIRWPVDPNSGNGAGSTKNLINYSLLTHVTPP